MYADSIAVSLHTTPSVSHRAYFARGLSVLIGLLIIAYMGMMVSTISLVNERKEIRTQIRDTQVAVSDLEVTYFDLAQSIDQTEIDRLGFVDSTVPTFAYTHPAFPSVAVR